MDPDRDGEAPIEPSVRETMDFVFDMLGQLADMSQQCGEEDLAMVLRRIIASRDDSDATVQ